FTGEFDTEEQLILPPSADTLRARVERHLEDHHLMIMETVNERTFRAPNLNNEIIHASRISGFENPLLALMASQFQSFSFYGDYINISGKEYLSPISPGSLKRYHFLLEDTTYTEHDTVYVISYRPQPNRNFLGLQGVMYINTNGWAIQNVIAGPFPPEFEVTIRIQQKYELIDGKYWFPSQLNTDAEFLGIDKPANLKILGTGRTYLNDIQINPPLSRKDFSAYDIEFSPREATRQGAFWEKYRSDTLSQIESNTYQRMDSLGRKHNLDRNIERLEALITGYWQLGIFDIDLLEFLSHNKVEGFRPGFGFKTNKRLSHQFSVNAHIGYGMRDQVLKYGLGGQVLLHRRSNLRIGGHYQYDRFEKGPSTIRETKGLISPTGLRSFFLTDLDLVSQQQGWLEWNMFGNNLNLRLFGQKEAREYTDDYIFAPQPGQPEGYSRLFHTFETGLMMHLAPGQLYVSTPRRVMTFDAGLPQYFLTLKKGWDNLAGGAFNYWKAEAKLVRTMKFRMAGKQKWVVQAGKTWGPMPWHKLFNAPAAYRKYSIGVPQSFTTMRMDEFFSDRYLAVFFNHNFGSLLWRTPGFSPQFAVITNAAFGNLEHPEYHVNTTLKSFPKGYFESGIAVLDVIGSGMTGIGVEFMVRYGPYAFPDFKDNYSVRLSYSFLLN
ncbi:MAG: DUF5686 family protein, partial [Bacteroidales bacterium]